MQQPSDFFKKYLQRKEVKYDYRELINQALQDSDVRRFLTEVQDQLHPEGIERSAAAIYEYYQVKTKQDPDLPLLTAGYEPFLRLNNGLIEVAYRLSNNGEQRKIQRDRRQRVQLVNLPKETIEASFNDYQVNSGRKAAFEAAIDIVAQLSKSNQDFTRGLYLSGPFGIGKTYLLGAMTNELAKLGVSSTLVHFPTFAVQMKQAINEHAVWDKLQRIQTSPVLIIDDIGADSLSPWVRDEVLGVILQYRMQEKLTTCFTSNYAMSELEQYLSETNQGVETVKAKRIMERISFLSQEIKMSGVNLRQQAVEKQMN